MRFSRKSCFCNLHAFCIQKSSQKPLQNEARRVKKSMPKTCCFSTSIFSRFGLDFEPLGPPSWSQVPFKSDDLAIGTPPPELHIVYGFHMRSLKCRIYCVNRIFCLGGPTRRLQNAMCDPHTICDTLEPSSQIRALYTTYGARVNSTHYIQHLSAWRP